MPDDDARPLGAALAAAREQRGLSVEDVAAATRIRATIIRAIEADDFAACGGAVYAAATCAPSRRSSGPTRSRWSRSSTGASTSRCPR